MFCEYVFAGTRLRSGFELVARLAWAVGGMRVHGIVSHVVNRAACSAPGFYQPQCDIFRFGVVPGAITKPEGIIDRLLHINDDQRRVGINFDRLNAPAVVFDDFLDAVVFFLYAHQLQAYRIHHRKPARLNDVL
jgi:hypothetical protein